MNMLPYVDVKKHFADVIKIMNIEIGEDPELSEWAKFNPINY